MTDTTRDSLVDLLDAARAKLSEAEAVRDMIPQLRSEIKVLERSLRSIDAANTPRRRGGPTIRESIIDFLTDQNHTVEFGPGQMLNTIHTAVGGNRNSVQVEIHRLEEKGRIRIDRDGKGRPWKITLLNRPDLRVVTG